MLADSTIGLGGRIACLLLWVGCSHPSAKLQVDALCLGANEPSDVAAFDPTVLHEALPFFDPEHPQHRDIIVVKEYPNGVKHLRVPNGSDVIFKPINEETAPQLREAELRHEIAAYRIDSEILRFSIVPPVVRSPHGYRGKEGVLIYFVEGAQPDFFLPDGEVDTKAVHAMEAKVLTYAGWKVAILDRLLVPRDRGIKQSPNWILHADAIFAIDNAYWDISYQRQPISFFYDVLVERQAAVPEPLKNSLSSVLRGVPAERLHAILTELYPEQEIAPTLFLQSYEDYIAKQTDDFVAHLEDLVRLGRFRVSEDYD